MWWEIKYWHPEDPNNTKTEIIDESNLGKFIESKVKEGFAFSMRFVKRIIHPSSSQLKSITIQTTTHQTTTQEKANRENKKIKGKLRKNKKLKYINRNNICYRR